MRTSELEELAVELATGAAGVVRSGRHDVVAAKSSATDLVTQADRATERWLRERLASRRPDDAILGEEGGASAGSSGLRWVLDPIDGTVNFVLGLPQYAVSVAVQDVEGTVAGAVCNPVTGEVFAASRGAGARCNGRALAGPREVPLDRAVVATGFSYRAEVRRAQAAVLARLLPRIADVRRMGAASLDLCAVAAGRVDGYFEAGLHPWDYAAGMLVATESGCVASGLNGAAPGEHLVAVAGTALAPDLLALLVELGADRVSSRSD
ncbi:MAG: inositol monophosphatase [Jatrophihabitans sp.]|nr:MAG: inositol monophosphatase [Jatrophihabitans sp.]